MKKISLLIIVMLLSSCGILEFLSAFEPDEGTISEYVDVVYDFNQSGDMVVVALNYDLTPSFNNRETNKDEYNEFYSVAIYDTTGKKILPVIEKYDYSCFWVFFANDSIIFLGINTDNFFPNKNEICILKYNFKTNIIDTLTQNGKVFNTFERGSSFFFSDNMKYFAVSSNTFFNSEDGFYAFDSAKNDIGTMLLAFERGFYKTTWFEDSLFLNYYQVNSTWHKSLHAISEGVLEEIPINLSDSIHVDIINRAKIKEAKYVEYDKNEGVIIKNNNFSSF